jgi:acid phosphatase (class A)
MRTLVGLIAIAALTGGASSAQPGPGGYLNLAPLSYTAPPGPTDSLVLEMDLGQVRAAIPAPASIQFQEAKADADAYNAEDIVRRFDDSTGQLLYQGDRPLLVAMLKKVIADTGAYVDQVKTANPRSRPYVEDAALAPLVCNMSFLQGKETQSYPSGHAMNGYVTALVLAEVFPDHRSAILARGVRYGDNRVACGVHHPIDVEAGRLLGIAYFERLKDDKAFQADLQCVAAEEAVAEKRPGAMLPSRCAASPASLVKPGQKAAPTVGADRLF